MVQVSTETDTRDRVIRTEAEVETLTEEVRKLQAKVDKLLAYVEQARGARWAFGGMAGLFGFAGGLGSGKVLALFQYFFSK